MYTAKRRAYYQANKQKWSDYRKVNQKRIRALRKPNDRKYDLKKLYGITPTEWDELFLKQGRKCAVCFSFEPGRKTGNWSTDHDHTTGKVRGILCNGCNIALGHAKDNPQRLRALADYLERGRL